MNIKKFLFMTALTLSFILSASKIYAGGGVRSVMDIRTGAYYYSQNGDKYKDSDIKLKVSHVKIGKLKKGKKQVTIYTGIKYGGKVIDTGKAMTLVSETVAEDLAEEFGTEKSKSTKYLNAKLLETAKRSITVEIVE